MMLRRILGFAGAALASLSLNLACVDATQGGSTSNTALYAFDGASGTVNCWGDTATLYANIATGGDTAPSRRITSSVITNNLKAPAVAGVCFDLNAKRLLLVDSTGAVVRIERADKQDGDLSSLTDIATFTLDSSERLQGSSFGQAALDPQSGTLYVTENGTSQTRIWVVSNPGGYGGLGQPSTAPLRALQTSGTDAGGPDTGGTGVAVGQGKVYAYFSGGASVPSPSGGSPYTGARLRSGSFSAFGSAVIVGASTTLEDTSTGGCLALDTGNNAVYVLRANTHAASGGPVCVFTAGAFTSSYDQTPSRFLGSLTGQPDLRILAHGGNKDWLGGAAYSPTTKLFSNQIWLWKNPSQGGEPHTLTLGSATISGLAFDGSN